MNINKDLEIERKFLLRAFPFDDDSIEMQESEKILIIQHYVKKKDGIHRYRKAICDGEETCYHTRKKMLSHGVFEEIEKIISLEDFDIKTSGKDNKFILKERYRHRENGLVWEVDVYSGISLITLEVELDDIKQKIKIPEKIKKNIIFELTGIEEFSNFNLATKEL